MADLDATQTGNGEQAGSDGAAAVQAAAASAEKSTGSSTDDGAGKGADETAGGEGAAGKGEGDGATGKTGDGSAEGGKGKGGDGNQDEGGAPETYEDFSLPEGLKLDDAVAGDFKTLAKELNLSQANAQKLVDLQAKAMQNVTEAVQEHAQSVRAQWETDAHADKEIGGAKFDESMAAAKSALNRFTTKEFTKFLNESGLGNHPEMIRVFARINAKIADDEVLTGGQGENSGKSLDERAAAKLYGAK